MDELLYYKGMSWRRLGEERQAGAAFDTLLERARAGLSAQPDVDFFAKFGDRESAGRREARLRYLLGLGFLGRGRRTEARSEFERALALHPGHAGARRALDGLE